MGRIVAKNFRFTNAGLSKVLGELESQVMDVVWKGGEIKGREVYEEIKKTRDIALTTVLTVLERLTEKGLVEKVKESATYTFKPTCTKDEFAGSVSRQVLRGVMELWSGSAVASFVDILAEKDPDELERLSRLVDERLRKLKGDKLG